MKVRLLKDFEGLTKDKIYELGDLEGQKLIDTRYADVAPRCFKINDLCVAEIIELDKRTCKIPVRKYWGICLIQPQIGYDVADVLCEGKGFFTHIASKKMIQTTNDKYVLLSNKVINLAKIKDYYKTFLNDMAKQRLSRESFITEEEIIEKEQILNSKTKIDENISQL